jgi:hypothetical protein
MDIDDIIDYTRSQNILNPEFQRFGWTQDIDVLSVVSKGKTNIRTGKGNSCKLGDYMFEFHSVGLEELASCRDIVEKVAY